MVRALAVLAALAVSLSFVSCSREQPIPKRRIAHTTELVSIEGELPGPARGMWVWGTRTRLAEPNGAQALLSSAASARLNEVYLSVNGGVLDDPKLPALLEQLRDAGLRVEALMGEADWYQPDRRAQMLARIDAVGGFNRRSTVRFAAIHLDVEPHQLPENRTSHAFLVPLAEALSEARMRAAALGMATSADLPRFAFEEEGALFGRAVARPFVMLYELRDRRSPWLVGASRSVIDQSYAGLPADVRGQLVVGLRVEDYPSDLDSMAAALDTAHAGDPRYGGWAVHDEAKYRMRARRIESAREAPATCP